MVSSTSPILPALIVRLLRNQSTWLATFWAIVLGVIVVVSVVAAFFGQLDASVVDWIVPYSIKYALAGIGMGMLTVQLLQAIATGITRGEFLVAWRVVAVAMALLLGIGTTVFFWVERLLHDAVGLSTRLTSVHLYGSIEQVHLIMVENLVVGLVHLIAGCLIGVIFHRGSGLGRWPLLALPVLPVIVVEWSILHFGGSPAGGFPGADSNAIAWFLVIGAVCIAIPGLITHLLVRGIPFDAAAE
ncbi:large-conductance mechanosensitive channel [Actinoalloteichus hoggarensis]|uniref:Uncharacterized protein n=1 Tax=Actinoalloteichus hoggarensis TaxID=1470176 RepID=A0A221W8V8_9PSEU|nr:hypothetical protein [Actinoalloteichus hoggarensis]ASO22101.1 hypothetical protein AHOG_22440 [Actinoalloteichus hoggarensis]MBB5923817.1 large-conductance mechanosensitive channel [Actinoalloteichus hoggarensis]